MARKDENIYKRKDGRWEARYIVAAMQTGEQNTGLYMHEVTWKLRKIVKKMLKMADMDYEDQPKAGTVESIAKARIRDSTHKWEKSTKCRYQGKRKIIRRVALSRNAC